MAAVLEFITILLSFIISVAGLSAFALASTIGAKNQDEPEVSELGAMAIINLTPHDIHLHLASGEVVTYHALNKDNPARAQMSSTQVATVEISGQVVPITRNEYGTLENVPDQIAQTLFIVSALAAQAAPWRKDLIIPSEPVRNDKNQVVGCRSFSRIE